MVHFVMTRLAQAMALIGGLALCVVVGVVCISITGRGLNTVAHAGDLGGFGRWLLDIGVGPINGDYELVEAGIAFTVFAFLPLTQLTGSHACVDVFTRTFGPRVNHALSTFWTVVMMAAILLITWRLFDGMQDKMRYGETTYLIQFPIWWAYAASFAGAVVACIISIYCTLLCFTKGHQT